MDQSHIREAAIDRIMRQGTASVLANKLNVFSYADKENTSTEVQWQEWIQLETWEHCTQWQIDPHRGRYTGSIDSSSDSNRWV